jgi:uncharacterized protein YdaU (DUF1376 family)
MSKSDTWMPLYIGDYLADTMHLNGQQHGAYLLLLMHQWRTGHLQDDDNFLSAIARCELPVWKKSVGPVVRRFFNSTLVQKRLAAERAEAEANSEKRATAGKAGAAKRWQNDGGGNGNANGNASSGGNGNATPIATGGRMTDAMPSLCGTNAPLPSPSPKEEGSELRSGAEAPPADARVELWARGKPFIRSITGMTEAGAGTLLGRLLRDMRDDCAGLLCVLAACQAARPLDPKAWLVATVQTRAGERLTPLQRRMRESDAVFADFLDRANIKQTPEQKGLLS